MDKILKTFGIEKIEKIVKESNSFVETTIKLGINKNKKYNVERYIKRLGISTEHFDSVKRVKEYKERYKEELLKKLISEGRNFKEILLELDILPVNSNYKTLKKYLKIFKNI